MGGATKPLIVLVGDIDKSFDLENFVEGIRERLEEYIGYERAEKEVQQNFIDPSITPMKVSEFCRLLDLTNETRILSEMYKKVKGHFLYSVEAMLRLVFFQRLSRIKYYTTLESKVKDDRVAESLGFKKNGDGYITPSERTINRFVNERLNGNLRAIHKSFLGRLRGGLAKEGIKLGRRISIDSTPLPTLKNDECGKYNAYLRSSSSHHSDNF